MYTQLAQELIQLAEYDLAVREKLLAEGRLSEGYNPEMEAVHRANAARLQEIIAEIGWPTRSKVGDEASEAAWLIVQHSIGEPAFMKACYELMLGMQDDLNPQNLAYLHDRICYFEGRPQRYGTQYDTETQRYPVENKAAVNQLRAELKLPPLAEASLVEASGNTVELPQDEEAMAWRKKVGWV
ncbi:hypothetical protein GCM10027275_54260 [Rhabdobacter roseus]|uniref:Uncharacterized protein n=1 Tax=Rhabdobacter roseus TaxID=1655419 RepID=A0A840U5U0_9BACT|nr:DUF6624 domain-containing protein [Rhabdobacter roseus]MBB5287440.1 hypothetical protein [Rhabdobacter roseus]